MIAPHLQNIYSPASAVSELVIHHISDAVCRRDHATILVFRFQLWAQSSNIIPKSSCSTANPRTLKKHLPLTTIMSVPLNGSTPRQSVEGKVAIVTGGGSGIGYCFCALLHSKGCNVIIGDLRLTEDAEKLVSEAKSKGGAKVLFKECDVTSWKQLEDLFVYTEKEVGAPDIVCPGAGIFEPVGGFSVLVRDYSATNASARNGRTSSMILRPMTTTR